MVYNYICTIQSCAGKILVFQVTEQSVYCIAKLLQDGYISARDISCIAPKVLEVHLVPSNELYDYSFSAKKPYHLYLEKTPNTLANLPKKECIPCVSCMGFVTISNVFDECNYVPLRYRNETCGISEATWKTLFLCNGKKKHVCSISSKSTPPVVINEYELMDSALRTDTRQECHNHDECDNDNNNNNDNNSDRSDDYNYDYGEYNGCNEYEFDEIDGGSSDYST